MYVCLHLFSIQENLLLHKKHAKVVDDPMTEVGYEV